MKKEIQIADEQTLNKVKYGIWLLDYKTYGTDSYVYNNKDFLHELYRNYEISMNDIFLNSDALIYAENNNEYAKALFGIYGVEYDGELSGVKSINDLIVNETAMTAIANSTTAMNTIVANSTAMTAIANSTTAMNTVVANSTAINIMYSNYNQAAVNIFLDSNYLLSACQSSSLYQVIVNTDNIYENDTTRRRTHYNGRCLVLGMSQMVSNYSGGYTAYVDTLNNTLSKTPISLSYGNNGLTWRINRFANAAKCLPQFGMSDYTEKPSYMAILKII